MMKILDIRKRKTLTINAIREMKILFDKINEDVEQSIDIGNFTSETMFYCEIVEDNGLYQNDIGYQSWVMNNARIKFVNGEFFIKISAENYNSVLLDSDHLKFINKIDFNGFVDALEDALKKYNILTENKDSDIERFILLCKQF